MDLRGVSPEMLSQVLTGGVNIGKMRADQVTAQATAAMEQAKLVLTQKKLDAESKVHDAQQVIADRNATRAELAQAELARHQGVSELAQMKLAEAAMVRADRPTATENPKPQAFKLPDGQYTWVTPGQAIPSGAIPVSDSASQSNFGQDITNTQHLTNMATDIMSGKKPSVDGKSMVDMTPQERELAVRNYNALSPNAKFEEVPVAAVPPTKFLGKEVPFTGTPATTKYKLVPKTNPQGKTVTRTGTDKSGRKVNQYSDGSVGYAN